MIRAAPNLGESLRSAREAGRKLLIPYVMGGMTSDWVEVLQAVAAAGADAIEVGIPFSDPMIDGPTIQRASVAALESGTTPEKLLGALARDDIGVPLVVMTYYNIVFRSGHRRFAERLIDAGVGGAIVPDLALEEAEGWCAEADRIGLDTVMLVAPSTPVGRAARICERSRGFVYAIGVMGVTGERAELASSAAEVVRKVRPLTELPACVGIGVSTPAQAVTVCSEADGVVVGSALVRRILEGAGPDGAGNFVAELRSAIDSVSVPRPVG